MRDPMRISGLKLPNAFSRPIHCKGCDQWAAWVVWPAMPPEASYASEQHPLFTTLHRALAESERNQSIAL